MKTGMGCQAVGNKTSKLFGVALSTFLLALDVSVQAQQPSKIPRIGFLVTASLGDPRIETFQRALGQLGYVEGKNVLIEHRYAEGKTDQLRKFATELVDLKVDVIVTGGGEPVTRAAKNATKTVPIVMVGVGTDPVEAGLVESLAHPGGNITGFTLLNVETAGKRLELFKEAFPKLFRVAVIYDPTTRGNLSQVKEVQTAAGPLGLTVQSSEVRHADDFERTFATLTKNRPDGLFVPGGPLMTANEKRIAAHALKNKLPSTFNRREAVEAGGLMAYAAERIDQYRRAAIYVDKILKGTKPADLPVEQPTKFEFIINLKTAKQIGLTIPPNVLARANSVIR